MATIKYAGNCDFCGNHTEAGRGDFQSVGSLPLDIRKYHVGHNFTGRWLIRCFNCKNAGNETMKYKKLTKTN